VIYTNLYIDS